MDETEVKVIQRNFEYLVKQGKAEYLLDRLFTMEAVDLDDYQRVTAQVTDSDKMRMLLVILLKKVPSKNTKSFRALCDAFEEALCPDIADMLKSCRQEYTRKLSAACGTRNPSGGRGSQGLNFMSHDLSYPIGNRRVEWMDVADCLPRSNIKDQGETTSDNIEAKTPAELSSPDHSAGGSKDFVSVSSKELKQSIDSAKGTKGQINPNNADWRMWACPSCPRKFNGRRQLERHKKDVHGPTVRCSKCSYEVAMSRMDLLKSHMKRHESRRNRRQSPQQRKRGPGRRQEPAYRREKSGQSLFKDYRIPRKACGNAMDTVPRPVTPPAPIPRPISALVTSPRISIEPFICEDKPKRPMRSAEQNVIRTGELVFADLENLPLQCGCTGGPLANIYRPNVWAVYSLWVKMILFQIPPHQEQEDTCGMCWGPILPGCPTISEFDLPLTLDSWNAVAGAYLFFGESFTQACHLLTNVSPVAVYAIGTKMLSLPLLVFSLKYLPTYDRHAEVLTFALHTFGADRVYQSGMIQVLRQIYGLSDFILFKMAPSISILQERFHHIHLGREQFWTVHCQDKACFLCSVQFTVHESIMGTEPTVCPLPCCGKIVHTTCYMTRARYSLPPSRSSRWPMLPDQHRPEYNLRTLEKTSSRGILDHFCIQQFPNPFPFSLYRNLHNPFQLDLDNMDFSIFHIDPND